MEISFMGYLLIGSLDCIQGIATEITELAAAADQYKTLYCETKPSNQHQKLKMKPPNRKN